MKKGKRNGEKEEKGHHQQTINSKRQNWEGQIVGSRTISNIVIVIAIWVIAMRKKEEKKKEEEKNKANSEGRWMSYKRVGEKRVEGAM